MDSKVSSSLVMISDVSPKDMRRSHNVDLMMVKNLWQAFLASQRASKSQSDCRLEYLFWRIWSSDTLLDDMKIGQLNDLVSRIVLPGGHAAQSTTQQAQKSQAFPHIHTITGSPPHTTPQPEVRPRPAEPKAMPQPILKKSSAPQGESNKTARLLLEQPDGGSITRNPSNSPTSSVQEPQPKEPTAGRQGPKKSHFTTGARAGRRRPVFNRRKSSQASVAKTMLASSAEQQQHQQQQQQPKPRQRPPLDPLESMQSFELVFDPDYVPPVEDSPPPPTPPIHKIKEEIELTKIKEALADIGSIEVPRLSSKTATATTTAATTPNALSDQTDPLLSQGLETVSYDPQEPPPPPPGSQKKQTAEPHDANRSSNETTPTTTTTFFQQHPPLSLPVPGFPSTRRIPMPQEMETILLNILHDESPLDGPIPLPTRPWWICEHSCSPLPRTEYLADWMLQIDDWDKQPSKATLAHPGFRTRFVEAVVTARTEEEAAIALLNEVRMPSDDDTNNSNSNSNKNTHNHKHIGNSIHRRSFNRTDDEREPYHSVLSHMVGKETQESRSAREEHLKWERSEQQPDQQERQQIVWNEDSKGLHLAHSPGSARVGYLESLDPTTFL